MDARVASVLGLDVFRADVLQTAGLDDRRARNGYLAAAEDRMAEAVGAEDAFFATCGSSLCVKAAMLAIAGGSPGGLLVARDRHKSIVAGLVCSGLCPLWIEPRWDRDRHLSHPPSPEQVAAELERHPDAAGALIVSPSPYGTCADLDGIGGCDSLARRALARRYDRRWTADWTLPARVYG